MERRWMLSLLLLIGIVGYFTVPAVAGYIINPGGSNGLLNKITNITGISLSSIKSSSYAAGLAAGDRVTSGAANLVNAPGHIAEGYRSGGSNNVQAEKLNGNPKK